MNKKSIDKFFNSLSKDELKEKWEKYNKYSGEGEEENNGGWIKFVSEAGLPKDEKFWVCTIDNRVLISSKKVLSWILKNENNKITHYQLIIKPKPPKF